MRHDRPGRHPAAAGHARGAGADAEPRPARRRAAAARPRAVPGSDDSEPGGPPVHDVCAVAWVAQPEVFGLVPARVQVETAGQLTAGMTVTDFAAPGWGPGRRRRQRPGRDVHRRGRASGSWCSAPTAGRRGHGRLSRLTGQLDGGAALGPATVRARGPAPRTAAPSARPPRPGRRSSTAGWSPPGSSATRRRTGTTRSGPGDRQNGHVTVRLVVAHQPAANPRPSSMASQFPGRLARAELLAGPRGGHRPSSVYACRPVTSASRVWASGAGTANHTALPRRPQRPSRARVGWWPHRPADSSCTICSPLPAHGRRRRAGDGDGGSPCRQPRKQSNTLQTSSRRRAEAAQVQPELSLGCSGRRDGLRKPGNSETAGDGGSPGPSGPEGRAGGQIGSPSTSVNTDPSRSPLRRPRPPLARAGCWPRARWP